MSESQPAAADDKVQREVELLRRRVEYLERDHLSPATLAAGLLVLATVVALSLPFLWDKTNLSYDGTDSVSGWRLLFHSELHRGTDVSWLARIAPLLLVAAAVLTATAAGRTMAGIAIGLDAVTLAVIVIGSFACHHDADRSSQSDAGAGSGSGWWLALLSAAGWLAIAVETRNLRSPVSVRR